MDFAKPRILGRTGLRVGPLGLSASYGAPAGAFEEAFEKGCNYFYWGSMRKPGMRQAIKNLCNQGRRDDLVIVIQTYSRSAVLMEVFLKRALHSLSLDRAEVLLLGYHSKRPAQRLLDKAFSLKEKGLYRFLGLSGHNRSLFPGLAKESIFDLFHIRYNAAHRGAEKEVFAEIRGESRPGIVTYTATRWGQLLNAKKMPAGEAPLSGSDCYRFVLSNPAVDVCMCGPKNTEQMREDLQAIGLGPMGPGELERARKLGDYLRSHGGKF